MNLERAFVVLALVSTSCALWAQQIETGYDDSFPLAELNTLNLFQQERSKPDELANHPETEKLIKENLIQQLRSIGLDLSDTRPDLLVAFYAKDHLVSRPLSILF